MDRRRGGRGVDAEEATLAILADLEASCRGSPEMAVVVGNSALAAVEILFRRLNVDPALPLDLYREIWDPIVERATRPGVAPQRETPGTRES